MNHLPSAILVREASFEEQNVPCVFYVTINGLLHSTSNVARKTGMRDARNAIQIVRYFLCI